MEWNKKYLHLTYTEMNCDATRPDTVNVNDKLFSTLTLLFVVCRMYIHMYAGQIKVLIYSINKSSHWNCSFVVFSCIKCVVYAVVNRFRKVPLSSVQLSQVTNKSVSVCKRTRRLWILSQRQRHELMGWGGTRELKVSLN